MRVHVDGRRPTWHERLRMRGRRGTRSMDALTFMGHAWPQGLSSDVFMLRGRAIFSGVDSDLPAMLVY